MCVCSLDTCIRDKGCFGVKYYKYNLYTWYIKTTVRNRYNVHYMYITNVYY